MPFRYIDFVVTGTPRSGTSYMSSLLNALGYDCSHERCFDPWHITFAEERPDDRIWGDSSWLAVPYLGDLPDTTKIVHVVRDPVHAINSILGTGQLHWADSDYRRYIAHHWQGDREWWLPRSRTLRKPSGRNGICASSRRVEWRRACSSNPQSIESTPY
jgi:hypothetical protein